MKVDRKYHLGILIVLWLVVHTILFWRYGIRDLLDANEYVNEAIYLTKFAGLDDSRHILYLVPIVLISIFDLLFPGEIIYFILFQIVISGLACLALYESSNKIFNSTTAALFSAIIYLIWWDMIHWNITTMTESLAASSICFTIYFLSTFKGRFWEHCMLMLLMLITFFIRPTGIITILGVIGFLLSFYWSSLKNLFWAKAAIIIGILLLTFIAAHLMLLHWDFTDQYQRGNIVTYIDSIEGNSLYEESLRLKPQNLELYESDDYPILSILSFIFLNPLYFLKTACLKIWYLISFTRPYYSWLHNLYSIVWMSGIYYFFITGLKQTVNDPLKVFTLVSIFANCALIGISTVDWDNRFFIPMEPGIVLMTGGGLAYFIQRFKIKWKMAA